MRVVNSPMSLSYVTFPARGAGSVTCSGASRDAEKYAPWCMICVVETGIPAPYGIAPGFRSVKVRMNSMPAQIREEQSLLDEHRRSREHRHGGLPLPDRVADLVPLRRHEQRGTAVRLQRHPERLPLDHRLRGEHAVVVALDVLDRIEVHVLVLQRVHELVLHQHAHLLHGRILDDVQHLRLRVVEAHHLFGEQIEHQRAEIERVGEDAEPAQQLLLRGEVAGRLRLVEHLLEEGAHFRFGLHLVLRRRS